MSRCFRSEKGSGGWPSLLTLLCGLAFAWCSVAPLRAASSVTLAWNANSETNLAGYRLYYGIASHAYSDNVAVATPTTIITVSNLLEGQTYYFAWQRMSTSPSFAGASSVPHSGQCVGMTNSRSRAVAQVDHRAEHLGDDVAGLAQHDGVADQHALAPDLVRVVQGRHARRWSRRQTGSITANGVTRPVRPTLTRMSRSLVVDLLRRVLVRDGPARRPAGAAEPALQRRSRRPSRRRRRSRARRRAGARRSASMKASTSSSDVDAPR